MVGIQEYLHICLVVLRSETDQTLSTELANVYQLAKTFDGLKQCNADSA